MCKCMVQELFKRLVICANVLGSSYEGTEWQVKEMYALMLRYRFIFHFIPHMPPRSIKF